MSASSTPRPVSATAETSADVPSLPPPAVRGAMVIPDRVVARVTARAAREALAGQGDEGFARGGLGTPRSTVAVHDGSARLWVSLALPYPIDLARACEEIRDSVADRVSHLTGMPVEDITLSIRRLVPDEGLRGARVR